MMRILCHRICFIFLVVLSSTILLFQPDSCPAHSEDDTAVGWERFSPAKIKYPKSDVIGIKPMPWNIDFKPIAPTPLVMTENQKITIPLGEYEQTENHRRHYDRKLLLGPTESGLVVVYWGVDAFFSPTKTNLTTLNVVDLKSGEIHSKTLPYKMQPFGISPNGKFLAVGVEFEGESWPRMNNLFILRLDENVFAPVARFTPFDDSPNARDREKIAVKMAQWVGNKHLFLVSEKRLGILLDLSSKTVVYGIRPSLSTHEPSFFTSPDGKYVLCLHKAQREEGMHTVGLAAYNALTGKQLGYMKTPLDKVNDTHYSTMSATAQFSPNGRIFATRGDWGHLFFWDFAKGKPLGKYPQTVGDSFQYANNRYVFLNYGERLLWDVKESIVCSQYAMEDLRMEVCCFGIVDEKIIYVFCRDRWNPDELVLVTSPLIPPNMDEFVKNAARLKERVMGPGDSLSLELNVRLNEGDRAKVEQHVKKQCEANNWKIVEKGQAEYHLNLYMTEPENEIEVKLTFHGLRSEPEIASMKIRPFSYGFSFTKDGKPIFSGNHHTGVQRTYESKEDFLTTLAEEMREKPDWFLEIIFPETITRGHAESQKNNATITENGILFD